MATYSAGVALAFTYEVADGTTGSFSPGGSDRAIFGTIVCGGFSGTPSITSLQYPDSSGTTIPRVGSDLTWVGTNGSHAVFTLAPGPTGSTTLYGDWAGTPLQSAIGGICYSGVDQTTPFSGHVDATPTFVGSVTTTVASVTVTGCTAGQTIVAAVGALSDTVTLAAFTAVSGTTLRVSDVTGTFVGVAMLEKVATGSSETLSVNVNAGSSGGLYWTARGARVNDAAGGGPTYSLTADAGTYAYNGTAADLRLNRVMPADAGAYAYAGQDASLRLNRVLSAQGGAYSYTGQDATLTYNSGATYTLVAEGGTYSYSGADATFRIGRVLVAEAGAYAYTGQPATLTYSGAAVADTRGGFWYEQWAKKHKKKASPPPQTIEQAVEFIQEEVRASAAAPKSRQIPKRHIPSNISQQIEIAERMVRILRERDTDDEDLMLLF
jgi:hypothetical protein